MEQTKHTPGAMRAAKAIIAHIDDCESGIYEPDLKIIAEIIDEETAAFDLLEIVRNTLSLLSENEFSDPEAEGRADAIREDINLAIAKAEKETAAPNLLEGYTKLCKQTLRMSDLRHNGAEIDEEEWSNLYNLTMDARATIEKIEPMHTPKQELLKDVRDYIFEISCEDPNHADWELLERVENECAVCGIELDYTTKREKEKEKND